MVDVQSILERNSWFPDYNPELQLRIVNRVIDQLMILLDEAEQAIEPYDDEPAGEHIRGHYEDVFYDFCYTPVVVSQTIISLVASYLEGLFRHEISFLCTLTQGKYPKDTHHRCSLKKDDFWDITVWSNKGKMADKPNIALGVWQLLQSLQLEDCFETDFHRLTKLIFAYRNFSMHNGFEWDEEQRKKFRELLFNRHFKKFKSYFSWSESGHNLWMVSIDKKFIIILQDFCDSVGKSFATVHEHQDKHLFFCKK